MKGEKQNRRWLTAIVLVVLLLGSVLMGAFAFDGGRLLDIDRLVDVENDDAEDAAEGPDTPITGEALERASQAALDYVGEGRVTGTEVGDEEGYYEVEITLGFGQQVDVHLNENFEVLSEIEDVEEVEEQEAEAVEEQEDEIEDEAEDAAEGEDTPITDESALEQASAAALEYLGEGRVSDTEVGDEEGYYEIEVTLDNGRQVDVHLDENFNVLGQEAD